MNSASSSCVIFTRLTRSHGGGPLILVLHPIGEALGDAVVHIRLAADFLGGFGNVGFGDRGLAGAERLFLAVAEFSNMGTAR